MIYPDRKHSIQQLTAGRNANNFILIPVATVHTAPLEFQGYKDSSSPMTLVRFRTPVVYKKKFFKTTVTKSTVYKTGCQQDRKFS